MSPSLLTFFLLFFCCKISFQLGCFLSAQKKKKKKNKKKKKKKKKPKSFRVFVQLEIARFVQGIFISTDSRMYYEEKRLRAKARTTNLNEDLGQVIVKTGKEHRNSSKSIHFFFSLPRLATFSRTKQEH